MNLIISGSLSSNSKSRKMGLYAEKYFSSLFVNVEFINLSDYDIPLCDGDSCYDNIVVKKLNQKINQADTIIICGPVYNFDLNSILRNLIEVTSKAWVGKIVGFICAAGGKNSYMAPVSMMNSLMLHNRCLIIPRFVYASSEDFLNDNSFNDDIKERLEQLVNEAIKLKGVYK